MVAFPGGYTRQMTRGACASLIALSVTVAEQHSTWLSATLFRRYGNGLRRCTHWRRCTASTHAGRSPPMTPKTTRMWPDESAVLIPLMLEAGRTARANVPFDAGLLEVIVAESERRGPTPLPFWPVQPARSLRRGT